jgi:hypothetical protein
VIAVGDVSGALTCLFITGEGLKPLEVAVEGFMVAGGKGSCAATCLEIPCDEMIGCSTLLDSETFDFRLKSEENTCLSPCE